MNPGTGEVVQIASGELIPEGYVFVSEYVAKAQLTGQRQLASKSLRRLRQSVRAGRNR